jgi:cytochrome c biogenesis protein CcmG/thiol:disulfide interchange protein DsbE
MPKKPHRLRSADSWWTAALVVGTALLFGMVILPRLGKSGSALVGKAAPEFALPVIHGSGAGARLALSQHRGKAIVLDFWASWCAPCREQAPIIDRVARRRGGDGLVVVGVNTSDELESAKQFLQSRGIGYVSVFDEGNRAASSYGVSQLPTMVVIGRSGQVTAVRNRVVGERELDDLIDEAGSS